MANGRNEGHSIMASRIKGRETAMQNNQEQLSKAIEILYALNLEEDVRQDAALRLCQNIANFNASLGTINTWVWWTVKKARYVENKRKARAMDLERSIELMIESGWEPEEEDQNIRSLEFLDSLEDLSAGARWMAKLVIRNGVKNKTEIVQRCTKLKKAGRKKPAIWTHKKINEAMNEITEFLDKGE